ncbi:Uncharacterised protein [Mycobacteroides abscessus subsp. massiliense]|nr:Uncharacterised protein [Mycobacteroides abscessus subsp. massiliense]
MHRRLGDSVHIDHARQPRMTVEPRRKPLWFQRFSTEDHGLKLELLPHFRLQRISGLQRIKRRGRLAQHADFLAHEQGM